MAAYISSACNAIKEHPEISDVEPADSAHEILQGVHANASADCRGRMGEGIADVGPRSDDGRDNLA